MKSLICNYIKEHGTNWKEDFKNEFPEIQMSEDKQYPLVLFKYAIGADFSNPIIQEARGIIIDTDKIKPVCWAFRKFGKYDESYSDKIDWKSAIIQEKIDGSIMKLWFNEYTNEWQLSTSGMIDAKDAPVSFDNTLISFYDLFHMAENWDDSLLDDLNKDYTYIFELVSKYNRVVIPYEKTMLYHIGTRNNVTGKETSVVDINRIPKPRIYFVEKSIESCLLAINELMIPIHTRFDGSHYTTKIGKVEHEGFVVVDKYFNRIKIKSPLYMSIHGLVTGDILSRSTILSLLFEDKLDVPYICKTYPNLAHLVKYYDFRMTEFKYNAEALVVFTRRMYEINNGDRKTVANIIKNHPLSYIGFLAMDNDKTVEEILKNMQFNKIVKRIEPYKRLYDGMIVINQ